ncbi:MAG: hypothetical protein KAI24_03285 [Planctomycetes bacterium]|nr:hypothetical protein [Planctomycetota bacterium]
MAGATRATGRRGDAAGADGAVGAVAHDARTTAGDAAGRATLARTAEHEAAVATGVRREQAASAAATGDQQRGREVLGAGRPNRDERAAAAAAAIRRAAALTTLADEHLQRRAGRQTDVTGDATAGSADDLVRTAAGAAAGHDPQHSGTGGHDERLQAARVVERVHRRWREVHVDDDPAVAVADHAGTVLDVADRRRSERRAAERLA